jgi:hypothetical protein
VEVQKLTDEMIRADVALFDGLGHYFQGIVAIISAQSGKDKAGEYRKAANHFKKALSQLDAARSAEKKILELAWPIKQSDFFVRRHEVASEDTEQLRAGTAEVVEELSRGRYPEAACAKLNPLMTRMMAGFERNARIEGVLNNPKPDKEGKEPK